MTDEITEDAIRSKAKAYLKHMGWAPGQRLGLHSAIELMTSFGAACRKITDRCAYPECGCDYDAICSAAVEKIERGDEKPPSPIETEQRERVVAAATEQFGAEMEAILKASYPGGRAHKQATVCAMNLFSQALSAQQQENERLREALYWALGEGPEDDFPSRGGADGAFWWRRDLRHRCGLPVRVSCPLPSQGGEDHVG